MRIEKKFIIHKSDVRRMILLSKEIGTIDAYSGNDESYQITSYYRLLWKSNGMSGKIRIREYSTDTEKTYFLENKYKKDGNGYKLRVAITKVLFFSLLQAENEDSLIESIRKIDPKILFFIEFNELQIKLERISISYKRKAFLLNMHSIIYRLTIDSNISLLFHNSSIPLITDDECILEIKGSKPQDVIDLFGLDRTAAKTKISKYKRAIIFFNSKEQHENEMQIF